MAREQLTCTARHATDSSSLLSVRSFQVDGVPVLCVVSSSAVCPLKPLPCHRAVFKAVHGIAHPDVQASRRMIANHFVWQQTSLGGAGTAKIAAVTSWALSLRPARGARTFLQQYRSTRWAEVILLSSTTAVSCAASLIDNWVSRFGEPMEISSYRGPPFSGALWAAFCKLVGVKHTRRTCVSSPK